MENTCVLRAKKEKLPEFNCATCTRCEGKYCSFYDRYVDVKYNRCFNHSKYVKTPNIKYVTPPLTILNEYLYKQQQFEKIVSRQKQKG